MNLTISPIKYNHQPSFGAVKVYKEFKQIPSLTCACCGKKMIPSEAIENIFKSISQPLSKLIKKGVFNDLFQNASIADLLTNFANKFPKDSFDKILCQEDNKKKCSKTLLENFSKTKENARSELRSASVVLKRIAPFRDCLRETEREVYDLFCAYAKEYPRKSLSEIVELDAVQEIHNSIYSQTKAKITKLNDVHLDKIKKLMDAENTGLNIDNILNSIKNIVRAEGNSEYKSYQLKKYIESTLADKVNQKTLKKILADAECLQGPPARADYFFVRAKKRKYNDSLILKQIVNPSMATFEHIKPKIKGGIGAKDNGIILCECCNSSRQDIPYSEFIQYNPRMPYNTQKQVLQISDLILHDRLASLYKEWPIKVASTLCENSDGKINVDLSSYCKKASKKYSKDIKKRTEEITTAQKDLAEKKNKIKELEQQIQELYISSRTLIDEISSKGVENKTDKALLKQINTVLKKIRNNK